MTIPRSWKPGFHIQYQVEHNGFFLRPSFRDNHNADCDKDKNKMHRYTNETQERNPGKGFAVNNSSVFQMGSRCPKWSKWFSPGQGMMGIEEAVKILTADIE